MSAALVGRERELALLADRVRAAADGSPQVVLLAGEPGIGKSRLAAETVELATLAGMPSCWAHATDESGNPPYWLFRQVVRALDPGRLTGDLAVVGGDAAAAERVEERFRVFEAVTDFLVTAAEPNGLLVVLDDLQWADQASLQLLTQLVTGGGASRLMVVGTYRDTEAGGRGPLRRMLAALASTPVTRMRLVGLTEPHIAELLGAIAGAPVPAAVSSTVSRRTRGNPFFVAELARLLGAADGELPDGVRDAVRGRLDRLSPRCRELVCIAAALGSDVDAPALAAVTGWALTDVLAVVDEATAAGIFTAAGRFDHDLIRETARLDVPTVRRLECHQRMAEYLAGRVDAADRVAEIAFHWLESLPVGDAATAARWAERAGDRAQAQLAWEEAAAHYGRAAAAATNAAQSVPDRCRLLLAGARAQVLAYDMDGARQSLIAIADMARATGDVPLIAEAALTMEGVNDFVWDTTGRALYEEALAGLPEQDSALRARVLAQLAVSDSWRSFDMAEPRSAAALAMAERVGDHQALVGALRARQIARSGPDGAADRLALGDRMLDAGRSAGEDETALWGLLWRFDALCQLGDIDHAEAELGPITGVTERMRSPLAQWHAMRCRAVVATARGRFDEARALADRVLGLAQRATHDGAIVPSLGLMMNLRGCTGDGPSRAEEMLGSAVRDLAPMRAITAMLLLSAGHRDEAQLIYRTLPAPGSVPGFILLPTLTGTAQLAAEFDDSATAAAVLPRLVPYADLFSCGGAGVVVVLGSTRMWIGVAAATLGRLDDAVRHLRVAAERNERAGMPPATAMARYELAKVLARRQRPGDRDEAAALACSVGAQCEQLGMVPLARKCRQLFDELSGTAAGPLTKREREIATLVSRGLTNRQIAAAAHISERTAATHVQNVLGKLGFTNRSQIAVWAASGPELRTAPE